MLAEVEGRRVAVLGDMLELGEAETEGHRQVGRAVVSTADLLVTVGQRARLIAEEARRLGLSQIWHVDSNAEAIAWLQRELMAGDVVLIKGSRGMKMEEIVRALRAESC